MPLYEGANACHSSDLKFLYAVSRFYTLTHRRKSEVGSEPKIIHLTAVRSLGGLQASLSLILSLYVFLFLFCCSSVLLSFTLFHCFLSILSSLALCASHFAIPLRNVPLQLANLNWRIKIKVVNSFLHFFFASPPLPIFWLSLFQSQLFSLKICHWETHMALKDHFKSNKQLSSERESRVSMDHFESTSKATERRGMRMGKGRW